MAVVKFHGDLISPGELGESLAGMLNDGYATEQKIDGKVFIRMTSKYFEELGDYIKQHPRELCLEYWDRLLLDTKNCAIMDFLKKFCFTHSTIKSLTDSEVDFCATIEEELK